MVGIAKRKLRGRDERRRDASMTRKANYRKKGIEPSEETDGSRGPERGMESKGSKLDEGKGS